MSGPWDRRGGDRRDFFRDLVGDWIEDLVKKTEETVVQKRYHSPPGALPEVGFLAACTRCGECGTVCPPHAIQFAAPSAGLAAGTPFFDPKLQPCIVCADMPCAEACPTDALTVPPNGWAGVRMGILELLPERCITFQGSECSACATACPIGPDGAGHGRCGASGDPRRRVRRLRCLRAGLRDRAFFVKLRPLGT